MIQMIQMIEMIKIIEKNVYKSLITCFMIEQ